MLFTMVLSIFVSSGNFDSFHVLFFSLITQKNLFCLLSLTFFYIFLTFFLSIYNYGKKKWRRKRVGGEYIGNIKTIKKFKNEKPIFKQIIISQDRMDMFEKNRKKPEKNRNQNKNQNRNQRKILKYSLLDWLVNYIHNPIKNCKNF